MGKVDNLNLSEEQVNIPFVIGETVKVIDGPFNSFHAEIEAIDEQKKKLQLMVKIFGRKTPLELNFMQVEKNLNMAKEISGLIKLQIRAGAANPAPPVGPALGAKGVNIMEFCKQFNARTQDKAGSIVPVIITVYADKSFEFVTKTAPAAVQILAAAKKKSGSSEPNKQKVGSVTWDQLKEIAEDKMDDLNAFKIESAMKMMAGTARSMGINVKGNFPY